MCEWVKETDSEGNFLKTKKYQGRYYVSMFIGNVRDHLQGIDKMEVKDDDTFILSYPKSGTHWVTNISSMLQSGNTSYLGSPNFLDYNEMETLNNLPSPRVFASHMTFDFMPRQVKEGKGKVIVVFRNPKDVAVSLHAYLKKLTVSDYMGSWEGLLKFYTEGKMVYGSWFESLADWEKTRETHKENNILYLIYEDMKQNLKENVEKMSSFLGKTYDQAFLDKVTERCTFKAMEQSVIDEIEPHEQWTVVAASKKVPIYRKGEIGDWKNYFTVAQNEYFDKIYEEKMADSKFKFRFE